MTGLSRGMNEINKDVEQIKHRYEKELAVISKWFWVMVHTNQFKLIIIMSNPELSLLSDRSHLSARESIKSIIRSAQINDNRWKARIRTSAMASRFLIFGIALGVALPVAYVTAIIYEVFHSWWLAVYPPSRHVLHLWVAWQTIPSALYTLTFLQGAGWQLVEGSLHSNREHFKTLDMITINTDRLF